MTASSCRQQAALRRDARSMKAPDAPLKARGKKDRVRWCGGHVGREHTLECRLYKDGKAAVYLKDWRELVCTTCGKQLDWYAPPFNGAAAAPPAWVTL